MSIPDLAFTTLWCLVLIYALSWLLRKNDGIYARSVAILVLGDIGRSPRMMYHAESFAEAQFRTYLIGYAGE